MNDDRKPGHQTSSSIGQVSPMSAARQRTQSIPAMKTVSQTAASATSSKAASRVQRSRFGVQMRAIASTLIVTTLTLVASPAVRAMQLSVDATPATTAVSAAARYADALQSLKIRIEEPRLARALSGPKGGIGQVAALLTNGLKASGLGGGKYDNVIATVEAEHARMAAESQSLKSRWQRAGVAGEIIARQTQIDEQVSTKHRELMSLLRAANQSGRDTDSAEEKALASFIAKEVAAPTQHKLNLNNLPWQSQLAHPQKLRTPFERSAELKSFLAQSELARSDRQKSGTTIGSSVKTVAVGTAPTVSDLEATGDAPHTDAIKALAQSLDYNPVKIYKWVHDNVEFFPSYGSVQGAQDTLDKKSGNAFDQASLTIALLRASGIPARYVVGVIDVPEAKLRNWLGDFKTIDAAQQILGQGGIPNFALVSGGRISAIRMEHVWVETWVSFYPSRGEQHIGNPAASITAGNVSAGTKGDTWVPINPSYKQHTFAAGMNLKDQVAFDSNGFLSAAQQGATVNETQGWVQNLNQANIKSRLDQYQAAIKARIDQNPNATVGDVLGTQTIIANSLPYLAGSLSADNRIVAIGERYARLPESLRAQFRYGIYLDQFTYSFNSGGSTLYQAPTSEIAGKKITIAWVPATDADRAAIEALLPPPNTDGSPIRPEQLPQGLPGSITLKAEIRVEGEVKAVTGAFRAGSEPIGAGAFTPYASIAGGAGVGNAGNEWDETTDQLVAGQQTALGVSIQGISKTQLEMLKARMEVTKGKLEQLQQNPSNTAALNGLTGDTITGDILTANIWSWFAELQAHGRIASSQARINTKSIPMHLGSPADGNSVASSGMFDRPSLAYGLFHAQAQPIKLLGYVTTGVSWSGVMLDIGHLRHLRWVKDTGVPVDQSGLPVRGSPTDANSPVISDGDDYAKRRWIAYNKMRGQYASRLEHAIPERFFNDPTKCNAPGVSATTSPPFDPAKPACAEGISAMKAVAIALRQGQKLFVVTSQNVGVVVPQLSHRSSVIDDVKAAVASGKDVMIHQSSITAEGWSGAGYSVVDPETGAGGYLIEGGARGGFLLATIVVVLTMVLSTILEASFLTFAGAGLLLGGAFFFFNRWIQNWLELTDFEKIIVSVVEVLATLALIFVCAALCAAAYTGVLVLGGIFALLGAAAGLLCYAFKTFGVENIITDACRLAD